MIWPQWIWKTVWVLHFSWHAPYPPCWPGQTMLLHWMHFHLLFPIGPTLHSGPWHSHRDTVRPLAWRWTPSACAFWTECFAWKQHPCREAGPGVRWSHSLSWICGKTKKDKIRSRRSVCNGQYSPVTPQLCHVPEHMVSWCRVMVISIVTWTRERRKFTLFAWTETYSKCSNRKKVLYPNQFFDLVFIWCLGLAFIPFYPLLISSEWLGNIASPFNVMVN